MRRQARQIRRSGMQPMMFVNTDSSQFPAPVGMILARLAWRYRSELTPLGIAAMTLVTACWTHATLAKWWALILIGSTVAGGLTAIFGHYRPGAARPRRPRKGGHRMPGSGRPSFAGV